MRKPSRLAAGAGVMAAAVMVVAGVAQALPAGASTAVLDGTRVTASPDGTRVTASADGTRVTVPMTITGFDAAVAKAHGYAIRTDAQGREFSVKAGAPAVATPDNTVYGNCGSSYMYEYGIGNHQVEIETGFNVSTPAVVVWWEYSMRDRGGTSSHTRGGGLDFQRRWADNERWGALTPGPASAWVNSGSDAILDNGDVCTSAGPSDTTTIY
jgi:hypothetical protein